MPRSSPDRYKTWIAWAFLMLGATLVRLPGVIAPALDADEEWVGVAAVNVLKGIIPPFIYGTPYQGSLGLLLQAMVIRIVGATPWTIRIAPLLCSLLFVALTFVFATRLFRDREVGWVAALMAAFPAGPFVEWSINARYYYSLVPVLGTLVLLLALTAWRDPGPSGRARWFVTGLVGGVAFWTNYTGAAYCAAVGALLLIGDWRRAIRVGPRWLLPGFLVGSAPIWLYNLETGRLFVTPGGAGTDRFWDGWQQYLSNVRGFARNLLAAVVGAAPADAVWLAGLITCLLVLGMAAIVERSRRDRGAALVPLTFALLSVPIVASTFGADPHMRYLFPMLTVVPLLLGAPYALLRGWSRALARGLTAVVIVLNVWSVSHAWPSVPAALQKERLQWTADRQVAAHLHGLGLPTVYSGQRRLAFLGLTVSRPVEDWNVVAAEAVDGSRSVAFAEPYRQESLEESLAALGARYEVDRVGPWWVYRSITLPSVAYEEVPPDEWSASAEDSPEYVDLALDRDIDTDWRGSQDQEILGPGYTLDLGRPEPVAMIVWIPDVIHHGANGLRVDVSLDGRMWRRLVEAPDYGFLYWSGTHPFMRPRRIRAEVRFPSTPATPVRFIRLAAAGREVRFDWSVSELFVYRLAPNAPGPDPTSLDRVAALLVDRRPSKIYGDDWTLARLHADSRGALPALPVNMFIDLHGRSDLYRRFQLNPTYGLRDRFAPSFRTVAVLQQSRGDVPGFERLLRESGYSFRRETLGDYAVYSGFAAPRVSGRPLTAEGWAAWASVGGDTAQLAIDGDRGSRWSSGRPQQPGDWFAVDLGRVERIGAVELDTSDAPHEAARRLDLAVSVDGREWHRPEFTVLRTGRLAWVGFQALRRGVSGTWLRFPEVEARFVALAQTGRYPRPWSIQELRVYRHPDGLQATR
jgi:4-amino-4-deoxy-L-arabinose transferase-like glycosyltransferase